MTFNLSQLPKTTTIKKKRLGRGYGSGVGGHTATRGSKGDKVRGKVALTFDGSKIKKSWLKRLPFLRGRGRKKPFEKTIGVSLGRLETHFKTGQKVDLASLVKLGLISRLEAKTKVKILSNGKFSKKLTILLPCTKKARQKVIKAGGKVENG